MFKPSDTQKLFMNWIKRHVSGDFVIWTLIWSSKKILANHVNNLLEFGHPYIYMYRPKLLENYSMYIV